MAALTQFIDWIARTPPLLTPNYLFPSLVPLNLTVPEQLEDYHGNPRLGFVYQHLCHTLFEASNQFQLVHDEIQLNDNEGKTIGAIDFLLYNQPQQRLEHWEVAIKFYLLHDGLWYGPNAKDRLDLKLDRMLNHQLALSSHPLFKTYFPNLSAPHPQLLMQGRLYYNPFSGEPIPQTCLGHSINPNQALGYWCYEHQLAQIPEAIYPLEKLNWASGFAPTPSPLSALKTRFVHAVSESGRFWFIVPEQWPHG